MTKTFNTTVLVVLLGIAFAVFAAFPHSAFAQGTGGLGGGNQGSETSGCSFGSCANIYNGAIAQLCFSDGCVNVFGAWGTFEQYGAGTSTVRSARQFMGAFASWAQAWFPAHGHAGVTASFQTDPTTGMITQVSCSNGVLYAATYNINCPDGSPAPDEDPTQCSCAQGNIYACSAFCPDGSTAPGGDPTQCSCAQGNMTICGGSCPDGSTAPYGQPSRCTCSQGNTSACLNDYCPDGSPAPGDKPSACSCSQGNKSACNANCPSGETWNGTQCVFGTCPVGYTEQGGQCVFSSCPIGYTQGTDASGDPSCTFDSCPSGYTQKTDPNGNPECVNATCPIGYSEEGSQCVFTGCPTDYTYESGACVFTPPTPPSGDIVADPSVVKTGQTSNISWSVKSVSACTISGTNGDAWSCSGNACSATTTETSSAIEGQTIYTLTCQDGDSAAFTRSATVSVIPNFCEQGAPGCL